MTQSGTEKTMKKENLMQLLRQGKINELMNLFEEDKKLFISQLKKEDAAVGHHLEKISRNSGAVRYTLEEFGNAETEWQIRRKFARSLKKKEKDNCLTIDKAKKLIGKKIKWGAPADPANVDYEGIAIIKEINKSNRKPLVVETVEGDSLEYAFLDGVYDELCYSDGDRLVTFEVI